jgi:hypothetical protein
MREESRFHVPELKARCELNINETLSWGWLKNISLNGAMISLTDYQTQPIHFGDNCCLTVFPGEEEPSLQFQTRLIHQSFSIVGVEFTCIDEFMLLRLCLLIGLVTRANDYASDYCWGQKLELESKGNRALRMVSSF